MYALDRLASLQPLKNARLPAEIPTTKSVAPMIRSHGAPGRPPGSPPSPRSGQGYLRAAIPMWNRNRTV